VYLCRRGSDAIRIVIAAELPKAEHNSLLHLFSAAADQVEYGAKHYPLQSNDVSTIVNELFASYRQEGLTMPYTKADFLKELALKGLDELTPQERLRGLPVKERLRGLPAEERLRGLPAEERLRGLPAEQIEAYLQKLRQQPKSSGGKRRKPKR
jgi:hypothetical protein